MIPFGVPKEKKKRERRSEAFHEHQREAGRRLGEILLEIGKAKLFKKVEKGKPHFFIIVRSVTAREKHPGPNQINIETHKSLQRFSSLQWVPDL